MQSFHIFQPIFLKLNTKIGAHRTPPRKQYVADMLYETYDLSLIIQHDVQQIGNKSNWV